MILPTTILGYLVGDERSIRRVSASPACLGLAALFVLSAGFAREYDGEFLLIEPWHLLIPLVASTASATVLFLLVNVCATVQGALQPPRLGHAFVAFLTLFWMTAPMAWLYGLPVERFLNGEQAMGFNLYLLAVVSAWRVVLTIRVMTIVLNCRLIDALFVVGTFANVVAVTAIRFLPQPVMGLMGGVRLREADSILHETGCMIVLLSVLTIPILVLGLLGVLAARIAFRRTRWRIELPPDDEERSPVSRVLWGVAAASVAVWLLAMPWTQLEQYRRWRIESLFARRHIDQAVRFMSEIERHQLPPHYGPPPRVQFGDPAPLLIETLETAIRLDRDSWVADYYRDELVFYAHEGHEPAPFALDRMNNEELTKLIELLKVIPQGGEVAARYDAELGRQLDRETPGDPDYRGKIPLTPKRLEIYRRLRELAPKDSR